MRYRPARMVPAVRAELCGVVNGVAATPPGLVTVAIAAGASGAPHAGHELAASGTGRAQRGQRTRKSSHVFCSSVAEAERSYWTLRFWFLAPGRRKVLVAGK